jgi:putative FmdB family regulatory protein
MRPSSPPESNMPIFDFVCTNCQHEFEALVRGSTAPECPKCQSKELEKRLSLPAVKTENTHGLAMQAAKRRDQAQGKDRMHEQRKYEQSHND